MKKKYSNKIKYGLGMLIVLGFVGFGSVFAAETADNSSDATAASQPVKRGRPLGENGQRGQSGQNGDAQIGERGQGGGNICAKISEMETRAKERMGQMKSPEDRFANWQEKATQNEAKLVALRAQWNNNRDAQFAKLNEKATTDAQKLAVADFEKTTKTAISTRQVAVDAAIATFRAGVKNLIITHENGVSGDRTAFEATIKAAFDAAKNDCQNNIAAATVSTNLKNALAAARSKFKLDKQDVPKMGSDIQSLITARKQLVDKAFVDFKATMETARVALKKAFPADTSTTTPTPVQ